MGTLKLILPTEGMSQSQIDGLKEQDWKVSDTVGFANGQPHWNYLTKSVTTRRLYDTHETISFHKPWLIQRGKIKELPKSISGNSEKTLSQAVSWDYMGSAEFEFGASANSLRMFQAMGILHTITIPAISIKVGEEQLPLYVAHCFTQEKDIATYSEWLVKAWEGGLHYPDTKESLYFCVNYPKQLERCDFWWDIQNQVMWCFNRNLIKHLPQYLANSIINLG